MSHWHVELVETNSVDAPETNGLRSTLVNLVWYTEESAREWARHTVAGVFDMGLVVWECPHGSACSMAEEFDKHPITAIEAHQMRSVYAE